MRMCQYHTYMDTTYQIMRTIYVYYIYVYYTLRIKGNRIRWDFNSTGIWRIYKTDDLPLFPSPSSFLTKLMVKFFYYCNCDGIQLGMEACFQDPNRNSIIVNPVSLSMEDFFLLDQKQNPST